MFLGIFIPIMGLAQSALPTINAGSVGAPSEPGMYLQSAQGFNKILGQIVSFTRSGSLLVSKLTIGIKTKKQNVQLLGPHAQMVVGGKPVFYFIPPRQESDAGVNAGDLVLVRLEEKAERRQFEIGAQGAWRASSGISITHQIQLFRSESTPGVYTITPSIVLGKGEYALYLARGEGMQAYVYDFSVNPDSPLTTPPAVVGAKTSKAQNVSDGEADPGTNRGVAANSLDEATAEISSEPSGADIEIDGNFVGSTPSAIGVARGKHDLRISKNGYKIWARDFKSSTGDIKIAAVLEPTSVDVYGTTRMPAEVAENPTVRDPERPVNSTGDIAEEARIGVWCSGNQTIRHDGIEVSGVQPKGPADEVGIQPGDTILAVDGRFLYTIEELRTELSRHQDGSQVAIRYRHGRITSENSLNLRTRGASVPGR